MGTRFGALDYERANAAVGWLAVGVLLLAALDHALSGRPLWTGLALAIAAVAAVPPLLTRRPREMIAAEVLAFAVLPVVARSLGLLVDTAAYVAIAALAVVIVVELDAFTALEMTPEAAVAFVVMVTMDVAAAWVVGGFAADVYLGTSLLGDQTEVMWDLVAATGVGVVVGLGFEFYYRRLSPAYDLDDEIRGDAA